MDFHECKTCKDQFIYRASSESGEFCPQCIDKFRRKCDLAELERLRTENEQLRAIVNQTKGPAMENENYCTECLARCAPGATLRHEEWCERDDEPITAEWWKSFLIDCGGSGSISWFRSDEEVELALIRGEFVLNVMQDNGPVAETKLPAVRTRGDVRKLVKLLGRE